MRRILWLLLGVFVFAATQSSGAFDVPVLREIGPPKGHKPISTWVTPVTFTHGNHTNRAQCTHCHHMRSDDEAPGSFMACRKCHKDANVENPAGFYRAWHGSLERSCVGCHSKIRRTGKGQPPFNCAGGCHPHPDGNAKPSS